MVAVPRRITLGTGVGIVVAASAALVGAGALVDNSFLTHLATGRLIWDGQGIPRSDPYTFTSAGDSWVVQSWLASVLYGAAEQVGGLGAIRVVMAVTTGALGALSWTLTKAGSTLGGRLLVLVPAFAVGSGSWPERPLLLGLVAVGLVVLAAEDRLDARWLLPVGWLWVNTHGSWPLGLVVLVTLAVGTRLDGSPATAELRSLRWLAGGFALAVLNPYGPRLLAFPVALLRRRDSLEGIVEWGPMTFSSMAQWAFLALLVLGIVSLRRRPTWRAAVPLAVFAVLALTGVRNVPLATLVLLPGIASGLAGIGTLRSDASSPLARPLAAAGVALAVVAALVVARTDDFADGPYPVEAHAWLEAHDLSPAEHRIVAREFVGNWFEAVHGATATVFMDDRLEVMRPSVVADHRTLLRGEPDWASVLDRYDPDAVVWQADSPLAALLEIDPGWQISYRDPEWVVAVPTR